MPGHFKYRIIQGTGRIRQGDRENGRAGEEGNKSMK